MGRRVTARRRAGGRRHAKSNLREVDFDSGGVAEYRQHGRKVQQVEGKSSSLSSSAACPELCDLTTRVSPLAGPSDGRPAILVPTAAWERCQLAVVARAPALQCCPRWSEDARLCAAPRRTNASRRSDPPTSREFCPRVFAVSQLLTLSISQELIPGVYAAVTRGINAGICRLLLAVAGIVWIQVDTIQLRKTGCASTRAHARLITDSFPLETSAAGALLKSRLPRKRAMSSSRTRPPGSTCFTSCSGACRLLVQLSRD